MKIKLLAFGIAKDILGVRELSVELPDHATVGSLRSFLTQQHSDFTRLRSLALAVNQEYVPDETLLSSDDEVVIVPPVSGG